MGKRIHGSFSIERIYEFVWFPLLNNHEVGSEHSNDYVQAMWGIATGDKDLIGEFNLGVNPALKLLPDLEKVIPYFGYGEGVIRLSLGDNKESGGQNASSYHHWLFLTCATVTANGQEIVKDGALVAG